MKKLFLWALTICWGVLIWRLTTIPDFHPVEDSLLSFLISNGGHFFFFGVFALLLCLSLPTKVWRLASNVYAVLITFMYGLLIELVQRAVPGRSFSLIDLALDTLGAITFLVAFHNLKLKRMQSAD